MRLQEALDLIADGFRTIKESFEKVGGIIRDVTDVVVKTRDDVDELKQRVSQLERSEDERARRQAEGIE